MHTLTALCCYVKCQQTEHSYMYNTRIQLLAKLLYLFFDPGSVDRRSPQKINKSTPAVWNQYCFLWVEMYYLTISKFSKSKSKSKSLPNFQFEFIISCPGASMLFIVHVCSELNVDRIEVQRTVSHNNKNCRRIK